MKSLIVVAVMNVNRHAGEYYDEILEVENQPSVSTVVDWANRVRGRIRKLWAEDKADQTREGEPMVVVTVDASPVFSTMLVDYQIVMGKEEGIKIKLPGIDGVKRDVSDREAKDLLEKLDRNQGGN